MLEQSAVRTVVCHEIRELLGEFDTEIENLADDDQLHELGLDSLLLARLIIQLETELGVDPFTDEIVISDVRSVGALVTTYERALTGADLEYEFAELSSVA